MASMFDLHTHSFLSDGVLCVAELCRRCAVEGYGGVAITDHCDRANIDYIVTRLLQFRAEAAGHYEGMQIVVGCELTHVPPDLIGPLTEHARAIGSELVLVHGETIVEPVRAGTNRAAIEAGVDVLAHPGLIPEHDAALAAEAGVRLELSGRKGHSLTNGHVARLALACGAPLSFGSDGHVPGDYPNRAKAEQILAGAGLSEEESTAVLAGNEDVFRQRGARA